MNPSEMADVCETAHLPAYWREHGATTPNARVHRIAEITRTEEHFREIVGDHFQAAQAISPIGWAKAKALTNVVRQQGQALHSNNFIEMAAGYSPRGADLADEGWNVTVADLPEMIPQIQAMHTQLGFENHPRVTIAPCDLLHAEDIVRVMNGVRNSIVAIEGFWFFPRKNQHTWIGQPFQKMLASNGGRIVSTEIPVHTEFGSLLTEPGMAAFVQRIFGRSQRELADGLYANVDTMKREFLERVGLVILENIPLGEALSQEERSAIDTSLLPEKVLSGMLKDREVQVWGAA